MNIDANGESESQDEDKRTQDGVLGDRKTSFQGSDLKVDAAMGDGKEGVANVLQGPGFPQVQQQQSQGTVVCWERFLHVRTIRVLLVESDDSTRHVVTALLRNCNYEVIEAANGLQAWKILEDLSNHIDIVLSEVVMPCVSGVALLCKIMSHKTRKNVPVIMMSSHDSMVLVFKCLSKGAVDFLLKPIRKNELKNLWQHVWRRCHSSSGSGSGSESGTRTQKSIKSKTSEKRDNSGSHDGENNGSNGVNMGDGSDDGSATQSSWTKQAVEVDSSPAISPIAQVADSTCAQVIRPISENSGNKRLDIAVREGREQSQPDNVAKGKNLVTSISRNLESESESPKPTAELKFLSEWECNMSINQVVKVQLNPSGESLNSKHKGGSTKSSIPLTDGKESGCTRAVTSFLDINKNAADDSKEPKTELSLKRLRGVHGTGGSAQDDRCILRRSEQSAFSRYNTSSNVFKAPHGIKGSSSIIDNSGQPHSTEYLVYLSSNGVSNNIDMGSTNNNLRARQSVVKDKSETTSTVNGSHPSAFRPLENDSRYPQSQVNRLLPDDMQTTEAAPVRGPHHELQVQRTHCYNYHHHDNSNFHNLENNQDELSLKKLAEDAPQCGSTNVLGRPLEVNNRNYRNRSASGSNHGSNGPHGSSTAINAADTNTESGSGHAGRGGSGDASGSGSGTGVEEYKLAPREAALNKFRQKRKERSFKKRVRYENRRKLAEQRPRVRGQFVKQTGTDSSNRSWNE